MRSAHATLFFDLVLSTMLVVVVLLSLQKMHADSRSNDEPWHSPMFVPISLFGSATACIGGVQDAQGERVWQVADPSLPFGVFQLPLKPGATSYISCESTSQMLFLVPESPEAAKYWLCPTSPNSPVTLRVVHDATTDSLANYCDGGASGKMPYPLRMDEILRMSQSPPLSAIGR